MVEFWSSWFFLHKTAFHEPQMPDFGKCLPKKKSPSHLQRLFNTPNKLNSLHNTLTITSFHCSARRNLPRLPTHKILIECVPLILLNYPNNIPEIILKCY